MNAIREYLNNEKYEPELYDDDGWKLLESARAELAQHDTAIAAAVAAEREACANVAEESEDGHTNTYRNADDDYNALIGYNEACSNIAAAIRARSNWAGGRRNQQEMIRWEDGK